MTLPRATTAAEFVSVGSVRMRVRRTGHGPPLLLINGIGAPLEMWEPVTSRLDSREIIAFDLPGTGRSSLPGVPMRMHQIARTVAELVAKLGYRQVDVLGYSFGGAVAQELAYRAPARVRRLVLCATTPGVPGVPANPLVVALMLTPARYYSTTLAHLIVPRIAGGRTARDDAALISGVRRRRAEPPSLLGYMHQVSATVGWSSQPWLRRLSHDTLVVHGDDDPVAPLFNARRMARMIPGARLHVVSGGGHLFLLDETERALPVIQDFLDGG